MAFARNEAKVNCGKYLPMNVTGHMTDKLTLIFRRSLLRALQDLLVTRVLSFPNANKKVYFNPELKNSG